MSNWVRFHTELRQGKHRGIPRALRFVFLELCLEARPLRGVVELPLGMDLVDGVHDLLGGIRSEVAKALEFYTTGPDPSSPTIVIEGNPGAIRLRIPSWEKWNPIDSSAERMRRLRENQRLRLVCDASRDVTDPPSRYGTEESREDQIRDLPPSPPPGDQPAPGGPDESRPAAKPRKASSRRVTMSHRPESWAPNEAHFTAGGKLSLTHAEVLAEVDPWTDFHAGKGTLIADFNASFSTWIRNAGKFKAERQTRLSGSGRPVGQQLEGWRP